MELLYFLEKIRTPFLNELFSLITKMGEEYFFLAFALIFIWCIDKKCGYIILLTGLFGQLVNNFLKITFKVPRPWIKDPNFLPVGDAIKKATGFSFPSGHTQNATTTLISTGIYYKKKKGVLTITGVLALLVAFSRLYLGVHYLSDVLFSLIFGVFLSLVINETFKEKNFSKYKTISFILTLSLFIYTIFQTHNQLTNEFYYSALLHSSKLLGAVLAFILCWTLDEKFLNFSTKGKWWYQVLKVFVGLAIVVLLKSLLKEIFISVGFTAFLSDAIRYFILVFFAGFIWPLTFCSLQKKIKL